LQGIYAHIGNYSSTANFGIDSINSGIDTAITGNGTAYAWTTLTFLVRYGSRLRRMYFVPVIAYQTS